MDGLACTLETGGSAHLKDVETNLQGVRGGCLLDQSPARFVEWTNKSLKVGQKQWVPPQTQANVKEDAKTKVHPGEKENTSSAQTGMVMARNFPRAKLFTD